MSKNNAMSELRSHTAKAPAKRSQKKKISFQDRFWRAVGKALRWTRRKGKPFRIALVCAAAAVLLTVAVTAVLVSSSDGENRIVSDITVGDFTPAEGENVKDIKSSENDNGGFYNVSFTFYKKPAVLCSTKSRTVGELIEVLGIELDENELMKTDLDAVIEADTEFNVDNVSYGTVTEDFTIDYTSETVDVESIPKGTYVVHQEGMEGVRTVEYKVTYVNGVETDREKTDEYVTRDPVTEIIYHGVGGMVNIGGTYYDYSATFECKSTVYSGGGGTASGLPASEEVIAVDPSVIPLGSRVYIEGVGIRIAADTGGSIIGNFIDIYYDSDNPAYWDYGVRYVQVYILD